MSDLRYDTISFLSDYGHDDEFVGVTKSIVRSIAPAVSVIDVTHGIQPHNVRAGGLALARAAQYLVPSVVLAVIDPSVGSGRRAVAVEVGDGASILVGPDNGLLAPAVALVGGATRAVELDNPLFHLEAPGVTFAGRDVFAPVAAHLCAGISLDEIGTDISTASLQPGLLPVGGRQGDTVSGEVLWVDHYGNVELNLGPDDLEGFGSEVVLTYGDATRRVSRVNVFAEIPPAGIGLFVDSGGLLALAARGGSAAGELGIGEGTACVLTPGTEAPSFSTPVELGRRQ